MRQCKPRENKHQVLQEPVASYVPDSYYNLAFSGISKNYLKQVLRFCQLSVSEMVQILPISLDTYKKNKEFKPHVTEKVLEIEEVYKKGLEAFGENFYTWMETVNPAMGNIRPKQLLRNSFGIRMLLDEIGRLEHGILA
jgi:putative toxin-antitoxin system antitoxin component (TIGR02293 family)